MATLVGRPAVLPADWSSPATFTGEVSERPGDWTGGAVRADSAIAATPPEEYGQLISLSGCLQYPILPIADVRQFVLISPLKIGPTATVPGLSSPSATLVQFSKLNSPHLLSIK